MTKNLLIFTLLFCVLSTSWAQGRRTADIQNGEKEYIRCFTDESEAALRANNPELPSVQEFEDWMARKIDERRSLGESQRATYTIPYIVHVIHNGEAVGVGDNTSAVQINAQIQQINDDFQRMNSDVGNTPIGFLSVAGSIDIEFKPALVDASNNLLAEPGIHRINRNSEGWTAPPYGTCIGGNFDNTYIQSTIKPNSSWDPSRFFNFWLMDLTCGILGYAQFPINSGLDGVPGGGSSNTDGVVFLGSSVGSIASPGSTAPYNLGRTATHEIGHWLGLRHIWGDGGCGVGDYCADTPESDDANYGCNTNHISCGTTDMVQNYMDYTDDACMNLFTKDQVDRFEAVLENSPRRVDLLSSTVWENPSNIVSAFFSADDNGGCNPVSVNFTDESTAGDDVDPINSWTWDFDKNGLGGASPSTFSGQNPPTVTFSNDGTYTVEFTVSNGSESNSRTMDIEVFSNQQIDNFNNGTPTIYLSGDGGWGYVGGHNNYTDIAKAESFGSLDNGAMLESADFFFFKAVGNSSSPVKFNVYNNTAGNQPGSIISTTTLTIGDLVENNWTTVDFPDIEISGPIYIGFELEYIPGDTIAVITNAEDETTPATAWEQFSTNDWHRFDESPASWGSNVAFGITANIACPAADEPPVADFEADDQSVCSGVDVNFTDLSTNSPTSWDWNFGDGNSSMLQNPTHSYDNGGNYTVTLTAKNDIGSDSEIKTMYISVQAEPEDFEGNASDEEICTGETVNLSMSGTFGATYSWEENGGGVIANSSSTSVSPTTTTTYTAICDNGVCRVTDEVTIEVNPLPTVSITAAGTVLTAESPSAESWQWSDGSGEINDATSETYTVTESGTYSVEVTDANGCTNTSESYDISLEPPVANFDAIPTTVCLGESVAFSDASTNNPTSWDWNFGDGNFSTMQNPTHTYAAIGDYTVELTATNDFGNDSESKTDYITVDAVPSALSITEEGYDLTANGGTGTYQWYLDGDAISDANSSTYTAIADGAYTVTQTVDGCESAQSEGVDIANTAVIDETLDAAITIFPNPVSDVLSIKISTADFRNLTLSLIDVTGRLIQSENVTNSEMQLNMRKLSSGVYIVKIESEEGGIAVREIVKK